MTNPHYNPLNLECLLRAPSGFTIWRYETIDHKRHVTDPSYFTNSPVRPGDLVLASCDDGDTLFFTKNLRVESPPPKL